MQVWKNGAPRSGRPCLDPLQGDTGFRRWALGVSCRPRTP